MAVLSSRRNLLAVLRKGSRVALMLAVILSCSSEALEAAEAETVAGEYQIKAVFLFNFAQFVEWPREAFNATGDPLVIGILGEDPFGAYLDEAVRGERVNGRIIVIERFKRLEDIKVCHILFICRSEIGNLDRILTDLKGRSILTVSDMDNFSQLGGMIRFVTENNRVRLRINNGIARSAGLRISSKLLRPSEIVSRRKE